MVAKEIAYTIFRHTELNSGLIFYEEEKICGIGCCCGCNNCTLRAFCKCMLNVCCCCCLYFSDDCCGCGCFQVCKPERGPAKANDPKGHMFLEKILRPHEPVAMSSIIWSNIGLTKCSRWTRKIVIWAIAIGITVVALILMVRFQNANSSYEMVAPAIDCGNRTIEIQDAWIDFEQMPNLRNYDLACFCLN